MASPDPGGRTVRAAILRSTSSVGGTGLEPTPKRPETEMRKVGASFESETAFVDMFATHVVGDGNIVTGQNQNSGYQTSHRVSKILAE